MPPQPSTSAGTLAARGDKPASDTRAVSDARSAPEASAPAPAERTRRARSGPTRRCTLTASRPLIVLRGIDGGRVATLRERNSEPARGEIATTTGWPCTARRGHVDKTNAFACLRLAPALDGGLLGPGERDRLDRDNVVDIVGKQRGHGC